MTDEQDTITVLSLRLGEVASGGSGDRPPHEHSDLITAFVTASRNKLRTYFNKLREQDGPTAPAAVKTALRRANDWMDSLDSNGKYHLLYAAAVHTGLHKLILNR